MAELKEIASTVLSHVKIYLEQLSDEDYSKPLPLLSDVSIGSHTRHVLDGFLCIIHQLETNRISYDKRERDLRLASDTSFALEKIASINLFINDLDLVRDCAFEATYSNKDFSTKSTLEREIIHNFEHVIHHLAIIKIALKHYFQSVEIPVEFGVAYSTLQYWEQEGIKK